MGSGEFDFSRYVDTNSRDERLDPYNDEIETILRAIIAQPDDCDVFWKHHEELLDLTLKVEEEIWFDQEADLRETISVTLRNAKDNAITIHRDSCKNHCKMPALFR